MRGGAMRVSCILRCAAPGGKDIRPKMPREPVAKFPAKPLRRPLSIDEALFLTKEAGYWTTHEVQRQIVRSPPFSPRENPFLLENFFDLAEDEENEVRKDEDKTVDADEDEASAEKEADPAIHAAIQRHFRPNQPAKFWHNNQEWLATAEGRGTRKRASSHVVICRGTGIFKVNGEADMFTRWPHIYHRFDVCQPFKLTGTSGVFDVFVETSGGGPGGQAGATRLAVARALLMANPACHDDLQRGFCLLEDMRQKMSKMPGKAGRRKSFPWTKR